MITVDGPSSALEAISELSGYITGLERRVVQQRREREEALQEAGRLRARVEELETGARVRHLEELLREAVAERGFIVLNERHVDEPLWRAREALGLDPRTGHRDVNVEAGA